MKKLALLVILLISFTGTAFSQSSMDEEIFKTLRGNASMNVVIVVAMLILAGIFFYLFRLDRKLNKLEQEVNEGKKS
ncbi:MAG: CcmD family protein [Bacteroidetes bacterium]|jgi:CcmD family protein|nr:CcmD family protein [Bacteroidota bacterium]